MVLPILVPRDSELWALWPTPLTAVRVPRNRGQFARRVGAPLVRSPNDAKAQVSEREALLRQWIERLRLTQRGGWQPAQRADWPVVGDPGRRDGFDSGSLLVACERLLRLLLRRAWRRLSASQRAQLQAAARRYEPERPLLVSSQIEPATAAWCMAAMHWRGCSHPAALFCAPMHPATALVRWLSEFSVVEQVQCPRQILAALARDISRTRALSRIVTSAMAASCDVIPLLPELLSCEGPQRNDEKAQHYYLRQH